MPPPGRGQAAQGRFYSQTRHTLDANFVSYFDSHGGVPLFGYPVTEAREEGGFLVQWTERERLEWHPEYRGSEAEVLLGLLGRELTRYLQGPNFRAQQVVRAQDEQVSGERGFFNETGQTVEEPFLAYWRANGGLAVFGFPISASFRDERGLQVQWFERARFELHPELPLQFRMSLGLLGIESLSQSDVRTAEVQVISSPVAPNPLEIGLAQGGESERTDFFDNVREAGSALGPGLVRLDNIYSFYHIVSRGEDGVIYYNWGELDRVVDAVRAMGKEPLICLSYMPEGMSASGKSRVEPPAAMEEWAALVRATVAHLNVERSLGIRYWEVWNEPNLWDFWHASFEDYLRLYDATVEAALSADPTVRIGGPAFSSFEPDGLNAFMRHETALGERGRVDFISWHAYGQSPFMLASQISKVREIVARYPNFRPELFITEFNVLQGGPGDTSADGKTDTVDGSISLLTSIEVMQRERLDRAFLFELKDGAGPARYWGRWGVLTNDGQPKPIYHALAAYQNRPGERLPVAIRRGPTDGTLGVLAYGNPDRSLVFLWYTGYEQTRVKLTLPSEFAHVDYEVALFDALHNNPARSGDATLRMSPPRNAGDLVFALRPNSLLIITSK